MPTRTLTRGTPAPPDQDEQRHGPQPEQNDTPTIQPLGPLFSPITRNID